MLALNEKDGGKFTRGKLRAFRLYVSCIGKNLFE